MVFEPGIDVPFRVGSRLAAAEGIRGIRTPLTRQRAHLVEAYYEVFADNFYYLSDDRPWAYAFISQLAARASRLAKSLSTDLARVLQKVAATGHLEPVTDTGDNGGGAPAGGSDDRSARYSDAGLSKSSAADRAIEDAIERLRELPEAQKILDDAVREYLEATELPPPPPDVNDRANFDFGVEGGKAVAKKAKRKAQLAGVADGACKAIQTLAAATVLWAVVFGSEADPSNTEGNRETEIQLLEEIRDALAEAPQIVYANVSADSGLRLRRQASLEAEIIMVLPHGSKVRILHRGNGIFAEVVFEDSDGNLFAGYAAEEYLE